MPTYAKNKKIRFDYEILETLEAGLVLTGQEVKSIRSGAARLVGAFITFRGEIPYVTNMSIPKYTFAGALDEYDPTQARKLLLSKKEINYLRGKAQERGLTIVPLSLYTKGPRIKMEVGIARGKKTHDKRETIKKRDIKRETQRAIKGDY